ncbi:MAG TPA: efflux RND transporter permease subunit [Candidatus Kapabacteria bacterium]|nr:efflux RND transporter permease subunit [Candidatus Kapabacteria bacterium]
MSLSSLSIRRPVLSIVMSLVIIIFGIIGYTYLGVREFPNVDTPIITVTTNYIGANSDVIETQITEPLEESINGIAGIRSLKSVSRDGRSTITVEFGIEMDLDIAANDVRDRVSRAQRLLPLDADPPIVSKSDADAQPIVMLAIKSNKRNLLEMSAMADNVFKERLQTIPGVSEVRIWGEKKYSMRMWMDPKKLAAFGLTPVDVRNVLINENVELPSGRVEGKNTELTVRTMGRLYNEDDFNNLIIKEIDGNVIKFKDIGFAELYPENDRTLLKGNQIPMVGVVLIPQPGANYINIADEFYRRIELIKKDLPNDVELSIGFDQTDFIRASIKEVGETIIIAFLLVIMVIYFFLRDLRSTIIPIIVIPISLVGAFFIMYIMDFSINVLTLLGIVLAIGLVVDDAIVVLENIYKKIEEGYTPLEAGLKGSAEIFFAIIATTITLAAVFMPIMFLQGITGRLFREFGIVIAGSVLISAFVALTLTPMMSSRILKKTNHSKFYQLTEPFFEKLNSFYANTLEAFISKKWLALPVMLLSLLIIYFFGSMLPTELAPIEDRSSLRIMSVAPEGSTYDYMENYVTKLVDSIDANVEGDRFILSVTSPGFGASSSVNSSFIMMNLYKPNERTKTQEEIAQDVTKVVNAANDTRSFVIQEQSIGSSRSGLPVQYVLQAPDLNTLKTLIPKFLQEARNNTTFAMVDVDLKFNKPEIYIEIDRGKAKNLGISVNDIALTLQLALAGQRFDYFIMNGKQYQVIGQVLREDRTAPIDVKSLFVRNSKGDMVQLDNVVRVIEKSSPPQLYRYNRFVSATISASLAPGKTIGDGIKAMDEIAKKQLSGSVYTALDGPSKDFVESSSSLLFTFILALLLIYLVLAAQFESFRDPFVIMLTVPLAISGAVITLWYFNQTLNIFSEIGLIMLIGLVTKNGILIVEFANQQREAGLSIVEAVKVAAALRFRPIVMTSLTTILGTLPIALALGEGAGSRQSMGIGVVGGLIISTALTLYVIPAIYIFVSEKNLTNRNIVGEE